MPDQLDAVARALADAIWGGTPLAEDAWELLSAGEQETYRGWARAAIDALGLTEEWRTTGWLGPVPESLARKQAESEGTLQTRLVSPWVRVEDSQ